jgi:hypothetical protein
MVVQSIVDGFYRHFKIPHKVTFHYLRNVALKNGFDLQKPKRLHLEGGTLIGDMASFVGLLFLFVSYILNAKNKKDGTTKLLLLEDRKEDRNDQLLLEDRNNILLEDRNNILLEDRNDFLEDRKGEQNEQENQTKILQDIVGRTITEINQVAERVLPLQRTVSKQNQKITLRPVERRIEEDIVKEAAVVGGPNRVQRRAAQIEAQLRLNN